jgi:hypothetical protein
MADEPVSDSLTIVIHLPQRFDRIVAVMRVLGEEWPDATTNGLARIEIPADE